MFKIRAAFLLTLSSLLRLRRLPLNETNRQVILVSNLMGVYYAVCILGDKIGLPMESAGSKFFDLKKPSVVQASGASWTGLLLCTMLADGFYVCFKCSESARLRYCVLGLVCACQRLTLQIAHSTPAIRAVGGISAAKEYTPGIIASFVFIGLFASVVQTSNLPAGKVWFKPATTTAKCLFGMTLGCLGFFYQLTMTDFLGDAYNVRGKRTAIEYAQLDWCAVMLMGTIIGLIFAQSYLNENEQVGFAKVRTVATLCMMYLMRTEKSITPCKFHKESMIQMGIMAAMGIYAAHGKDIMKKLKLA